MKDVRICCSFKRAFVIICSNMVQSLYYSMIDINDLIIMLWKHLLLNYEIIFISIIIIFLYLAHIS